MAEMAREQVSALLISQNAEAISLETELLAKEAELAAKGDRQRFDLYHVVLDGARDRQVFARFTVIKAGPEYTRHIHQIKPHRGGHPLRCQRNAGAVFHLGFFVAADAVDQRGFPDVRLTDDRDPRTVVLLFFPAFRRESSRHGVQEVAEVLLADGADRDRVADAKVVEFVNERDKPLAFYYFGKESEGWDVVRRTSSEADVSTM